MNNITNLIPGSILLSVGAALLYTIKDIPKVIINKIKQHFIYTVIVYDYDELYYVIEKYIHNNHNHKYKTVEAGYEEKIDTINEIGKDINSEYKKQRNINYTQEPNIFTIKYQNKYIYFKNDKKELTNKTVIKQLFTKNFQISAIFGKKIITNLLNEITTEYNNKISDNKLDFYVWNYGIWTKITSKNVKPIDNIIFNNDIKQLLINDLDNFINNNQWYYDTNINYKRNYCIYGPPGTGKTSLSFAIASYTKRNIYCLNMGSINHDSELISAFSKLNENSILLIEDIDSAFTERTNKNNRSELTFSCVLNCLDGVFNKEGAITIITTNHKEKLDPALIRPGRIDMQLEMPLASTKEIQEFISIFYKLDIDKNIKNDLQFPISKIQEICINNKTNYKETIKCINNGC